MYAQTMLADRSVQLQEWGIAALRTVVGVVFLAHGAQKLFQFGFGGVAGTFEQLGVPAPMLFAVVVTLLELVGGAALALGLFTRPLAALFAVEMLVAIPSVHLAKGFFVAAGGYEHALMMLTASAALVLTGPGAPALDAILGGRRFGAARSGREAEALQT